VLAVLCFHAGLLRGGWLGVEMFFVLSGFLITSLLIAERHATGSIALAGFWLRRARRLLPALGVLLVVIAVLAVLGQIEVRTRGIVGALTYSTNWLQITDSAPGYWDEFGLVARDPTEHLWSLAIEEQVYLVFPVLAWVCLRFRKRGPHALLIMCCGLLAASWGVAAYGASRGWAINRLYLGTDTRVGGFLVGAIGAIVLAQSSNSAVAPPAGRWRRVGRSVAVGLAGASLATAFVALDGDHVGIFRGPVAGVAVATMAVIGIGRNWHRGPLTWAPTQAIGRWSYGIYLFHWPIVRSDALDDMSAPVRLVVTLAVSTALAAASYRIVEQPIRHRRRAPRLRQVLAATTATAVVTALSMASPAGPTIATSDTLAPRQQPTPNVDTLDNAPSTDGTPSASSSPPVEAQPLRVLIVGDSVPALATEQLLEVAEGRPLVVDVYARPACVDSLDRRDQLDPDCVPFLEGIPQRIAASDPDVVVLWWGGTGASLLDLGAAVNHCTTAANQATARRLDNLADMVDDDLMTVVVTPSPRLDQGERGPAGTICHVAAMRFWAADNEVSIIDVGSFVCPSYPDDCERVGRVDGLHYDEPGARQVANFLFDELLALAEVDE
jgi:peptidoglycan/LPS O-acetylase OafA/YrhL